MDRPAFLPAGSRARPVVLLAGALAILLMFVLGLQQWQQARSEEALRASLAESRTRQRAVYDYLAGLQDIETGQRGYLVTGKAEFLEPFLKAESDIGRMRVAVARAFGDEGRAKTVATDLLEAGERRKAHAEVAVGLWRDGRHDEATEWIRSGDGKRLMDRARALAAGLIRREDEVARALLLEGSVERSGRQRWVLLTEGILLVALLAMVLALIRMVRGLETSGRRLRDGATRQAAIFENATDAMMMLDDEGRIEATNAAAERLFGRTRDRMIGQSNLSLFKEPPSLDVSLAYLARLVASEGPGGNKQDFVGLREDGTEIETEVVTTPIRLEDGLHFLAVARDATERRRVERLKNEFVATVSHELRTPLTSIAGALGLLAGGAAGPLDPKAHRLITIAHNNSERLVRLINDILDIEKIESGKIVFDLEALDLNTLIEQVVQANEAFGQQHDVDLVFERPTFDLVAIADRDRLVQVLTNLISNAVKFSKPATAVIVRAQPNAGRIVIDVADQGVGIAEEFRSRIFAKFAQADSTDTRAKGGTGLGLSIVKQLVERMDGRVWFDSIPGEGTTFHVELPNASPAPPSDEQAEALGRIAGHELPQVLHVDDDPDMLRLVASTFEGKVEIHSTPILAEAEAAIRRFTFDAIILDIGMMDGNGLDLVPVIRGAGPTPIILFTARDASDVPAGLAEAVLTKSKASLDMLTKTVTELLESRASR